MTNGHTVEQGMSRRRLLAGAGLLTLAGTGMGLGVLRAAATSDQILDEVTGRLPAGFTPERWSDPRSWADRHVPGPDDIAIVDRVVVVEGPVSVAGVQIEPQGVLVFSPQVSTLIESRGNVVVEGQLVMRPARSDVAHTLRFVDVDESAFVGGHTHTPMESDVGLWVTGHGLLDAFGASKSPWTRVIGSARSGATTLRLESDPTGWQLGDVLLVCPTLPRDRKDYTDAYDEATIVAIDGRNVTLSSPLSFDHPAFDHPSLPQILGAEVLNLTRNVRIEGTPGGRAHTQFLHTEEPQELSYVAFQHLGARYSDSDRDGDVVGRYPLHFHMCGDDSRGSVITGCVVRDSGNSGFVTHLSNGVDYDGCIAHDTFEAPYWWDARAGGPGSDHPPSDDVRYLSCVGSRRILADPRRPRRSSIFTLLEGEGNAAMGCVAVGGAASGFNWPEGSHGVWDFRDCIAHNLGVSGIRGWQNSWKAHIIERFVVYRCGGRDRAGGGIDHGAYSNRYLFRDGLVAECGGGGRTTDSAVVVHATSRASFDGSGENQLEERLRFINLVIDADNEPYAVESTLHRQDSMHTRYEHCTFTGYTDHGYAFTFDRDSEPDRAEFIDCRFDDDRRAWLHPNAPAGSEHVLNPDGDGAELSDLWFPVPAST